MLSSSKIWEPINVWVVLVKADTVFSSVWCWQRSDHIWWWFYAEMWEIPKGSDTFSCHCIYCVIMHLINYFSENIFSGFKKCKNKHLFVLTHYLKLQVLAVPGEDGRKGSFRLSQRWNLFSLWCMQRLTKANARYSECRDIFVLLSRILFLTEINLSTVLLSAVVIKYYISKSAYAFSIEPILCLISFFLNRLGGAAQIRKVLGILLARRWSRSTVSCREQHWPQSTWPNQVC